MDELGELLGRGRSDDKAMTNEERVHAIFVHLGYLRRDLDELKGRINGLIMVLIGAVILEVARSLIPGLR